MTRTMRRAISPDGRDPVADGRCLQWARGQGPYWRPASLLLALLIFGACTESKPRPESLTPITPSATSYNGPTPGRTAGPDDRALVDAFIAFAKTPTADTHRTLPFAAHEIKLGLGRDLLMAKTPQELADPQAWVLPAEEFRAYTGPFSPLEKLRGSDRVTVIEGPYPHCASPPEPEPVELQSLRRVNVQPTPGTQDSCLDWWAVDLFHSPDKKVVAVTLDLYEP